jgi:P27 family predicted phage terminase small subunit
MTDETEQLDIGEAPAADGAVEAPRWARLDGDAAEIWADLYPKLRAMNFVRQQDLGPLARYCKNIVRWLNLDAAVAQNGETYWTESKHGKLQRINPDLNALLRVEKALTDFEDRFGVGPKARLEILSKKSMTQGDLPLDAPPTKTEQPGGEAGSNLVTFPGIGAVPARAKG